MIRCEECYETFKWDDDVVSVNDDYYHKKCVEMVPSEYVIYVNGEYVGEVEYEDMACFILDTDDYSDGDSNA